MEEQELTKICTIIIVYLLAIMIVIVSTKPFKGEITEKKTDLIEGLMFMFFGGALIGMLYLIIILIINIYNPN